MVPSNTKPKQWVKSQGPNGIPANFLDALQQKTCAGQETSAQSSAPAEELLLTPKCTKKNAYKEAGAILSSGRFGGSRQVAKVVCAKYGIDMSHTTVLKAARSIGESPVRVGRPSRGATCS